MNYDANFQGVVSDIQFIIESDNPAVTFGNVIQSSPESAYIPMEKAGNDTIIAGFRYQTFVGIGLVNINQLGIGANWLSSGSTLLMKIVPSAMNGNFSIVNNAYTSAKNRDAYIELNGLNRTGGITCGTMPLPISLQLSAMWQGKAAFLQWTNDNTAHFHHIVIERADNQQTFAAIDTLAGDSSSYTDAKVQFSCVSSFLYRIKGISINGEETLSNTQHLSLNNDFEVRFYPNPVSSELYLQIVGSNTDSVKIELFNPEGKILYQSVFEVDKNLSLPIDVSSFAEGVYFVKVGNGTGIKTYKFVKM